MAVAEYERPNGESCCAQVQPFRGRDYFSFRVWYENSTTGEKKPGKNGINLPMEEADDFLRLVVETFGRERVAEALSHSSTLKE